MLLHLPEQLLFYVVVLGWELGSLVCVACRGLPALSAQTPKGAVEWEGPAGAALVYLQLSSKVKTGRCVTLPAVATAVHERLVSYFDQ